MFIILSILERNMVSGYQTDNFPTVGLRIVQTFQQTLYIPGIITFTHHWHQRGFNSMVWPFLSGLEITWWITKVRYPLRSKVFPVPLFQEATNNNMIVIVPLSWPCIVHFQLYIDDQLLQRSDSIGLARSIQKIGDHPGDKAFTLNPLLFTLVIGIEVIDPTKWRPNVNIVFMKIQFD